MHEAAPPQPSGDKSSDREAFRAFMTERRLRATDWAKQANIPASHIYAYLTGRSRTLPRDVAELLARAARVRVEDMFTPKTG
jgi:predicted transcriptional regulator